MQPQDSVDVTFCDLCNTSVPLQDLERGAAVRHQGKTVGACCLAVLRTAPASGAAPAAQPGSRPADSRLLPLGIAVLAAVAAATIFVDSRVQNLEDRSMRKLAELDGSLKANADVVTKVGADLDGVARRSDFDSLGERFAAIDAAGGKLADQLRTQSEEFARANAKVLERIAEVEQHRPPDYAPTLDELRHQLQQQAAVLAELRAQPHAAPAPAQPDKPADAPPPPDNGLPAALAHEVQKLKDEDPAARFIAVDALLRSKNVAVVEHLLPMAKDNDVLVRRLVVDGLKDFKQAAVVEVLLVALADPADIVADTAWRSLKDLTGQKMPFDAKGSREERNRAQKTWRDWWDKNRNGFGS